ncbi:hypothetical protein EWI07_01760 [Sporolactobacillus sp. THM7-4]|nr:hypothetical protein EWI07_01760 [Sporolactobacillus sp. THM7-4]
MHDLCKKYMNYHVIAHMKDGTKKEAIIEEVDDNSVIMLIPEEVDSEERQFYGYGPGYRPRFRRFHRFRFPFYLFVYPFIYPYPYYY